MGLEKLHPFDAGKWGKVIHFLRGKVKKKKKKRRGGLLRGHVPKLMHMDQRERQAELKIKEEKVES